MEIITEGTRKENQILVDNFSATYSAESDSNSSDETQEIKVSLEDAGGGNYFIIETKRWAFDNIEELLLILTDFQKRVKQELT